MWVSGGGGAVELEDIPRSNNLSPTYGIRGFGIMIVVCPAYAINKGRAAIDGSTNFLLLVNIRKAIRIQSSINFNNATTMHSHSPWNIKDIIYEPE
jgi:hypothetical protein